jgi:hypothetical protein
MAFVFQKDAATYPVATPAQRAILSVLCEIAAANGGRIFPSQTFLSKNTGCSRSSASRTLASLVADGVLVLVRPADMRANRAAEYRIDVDKLRAGAKAERERAPADRREAPRSGIGAGPKSETARKPAPRKRKSEAEPRPQYLLNIAVSWSTLLREAGPTLLHDAAYRPTCSTVGFGLFVLGSALLQFNNGPAPNMTTINTKNISNQDSLPSVGYMLERADDDDRVLDEQAEPQSVEIAAAAPKGSSASMTDAERAERRRQLLAELALLDPTSMQAECRAADTCHASPASELRETAAPIAGDDESIDAEFVEVAEPVAAPGLGSDLFGEPAKPRKITQAEIDAAFAEFWRAYPRKVGKQDAAKAFAAIAKKGVDLAHVTAAAGRYADANRAAGTELNFLKHPGGWLRDARFDDDPATLPQPRGRKSGEQRGGYSGGSSSLGNFQRGMDRILEQAQAAERARREAELEQAEAYRRSSAPF